MNDVIQVIFFVIGRIILRAPVLFLIATLCTFARMKATRCFKVAKEILESFKSFSLLGSTSHPPPPPPVPKVTFPPRSQTHPLTRCSSLAKTLLLTSNTLDLPCLNLKLVSPCPVNWEVSCRIQLGDPCLPKIPTKWEFRSKIKEVQFLQAILPVIEVHQDLDSRRPECPVDLPTWTKAMARWVP